MNLKNIIKKYLFPNQELLMELKNRQIESYLMEIQNLRTQIEEKKVDPYKPALMDFTTLETDGLPKHFLEIEDLGKRAVYISQLHEIHSLEVWHEMVNYYINAQANYTMRQNKNVDTALLTGRAAINSIGELDFEVKKGHAEYVDRSKPPETFDKFSVDLLEDND